jgi:hypothetical protein
MSDLVPDPRVTFAVIKLQDALEALPAAVLKQFHNQAGQQREMLARWQSLFVAEHLPTLAKAEFESFLKAGHFLHGDGSERSARRMTEDMARLRRALTILTDEDRPVAARLNAIRPDIYWGAHSATAHLSLPVLTTVLHVSAPQRYGIWNAVADAGLKSVRLWDDRWVGGNHGDIYAAMNRRFQQLASGLAMDLGALALLWGVLQK